MDNHTLSPSTPMPTSGNRDGAGVAATKPWRWVPSAWLAMGLAYTLVTNIAALLLRDLGLDGATAIACASALGAPYVVKPLYAPIVELRRTKRFFLLIAEIFVAAGLLAIALLLVGFPLRSPVNAVVVLLGVVAIAGSVQDIACEGIYLASLDRRRQALFSGVQSIFWNGAALIGGGALIAASGAGLWGWSGALALGALFYLVAPLWHRMTMPASARRGRTAGDPPHTLAAALATFPRRAHFWPSVALCLAFPVAAGLIEKTSMFFLIDSPAIGGLGLSRSLLGAFSTTAGFAGLFIGAALGSVALDRRDLPQLMLPMTLAASLPAAIYLALAVLPAMPPAAAAVALFADRALTSFGMVGYVVFLQRAFSPGPFPTTHYNLASGLKALTMMLAGAASGSIEHALGYASFFLLTLACALPALLLCRQQAVADATHD